MLILNIYFVIDFEDKLLEYYVFRFTHRIYFIIHFLNSVYFMSVYFVNLKFHLRNTFFLSKQAVTNSVSVFIIKNTYLLMLLMNACHLCGQSSVKK